MTPDQRHADVVARYPGGLTPEQFRCEALASAGEDGQVDPPALANWWKQQSLLIAMMMDGLIEKHGDGRAYDRTGPWFLTAKGKAEAAR